MWTDETACKKKRFIHFSKSFKICYCFIAGLPIDISIVGYIWSFKEWSTLIFFKNKFCRFFFMKSKMIIFFWTIHQRKWFFRPTLFPILPLMEYFSIIYRIITSFFKSCWKGNFIRSQIRWL